MGKVKRVKVGTTALTPSVFSEQPKNSQTQENLIRKHNNVKRMTDYKNQSYLLNDNNPNQLYHIYRNNIHNVLISDDLYYFASVIVHLVYFQNELSHVTACGAHQWRSPPVVRPPASVGARAAA